MKENLYIFVLLEQIHEWMIDWSPDKQTWEEMTDGLTTYGIAQLNMALAELIKGNCVEVRKDGRIYTNLKEQELENITFPLFSKENT